MKVILLLAAAWAVSAAAAPPASPPALPAAPATPAEQAAEHLMAVMHTDDQFRQFVPKIIDALVPTLVKGNGGREADVRRIVSEEFGATMLQSGPLVHAANRRMLAEHFTARDLDDVAAFYASPVGQKLVREMPAIQLQMMQVGQQIGQAAMQAALPRIMGRMRAANMTVPQGV